MSNTSKIVVELSSKKTVLIIFTMLVSLITSLLIINGTVLPYEGKKVYKFGIAVDSLVFTPVSDESLTLQNRGDSIAAAPSAHKAIGKSSLTFNQNSKLLIWMLFFSIVVSLGLSLSILFTEIALLIIRKFQILKRTVFINLLLLVIIAGAIVVVSGGKASGKLLSAFAIINKFEILLSDTIYLQVMLILTIISASIALYGILLINTGIGMLPSKEKAEQVELFVTLKESMAILLNSIAIIIMLSVITTALLQQAIEKVLHIEGLPIFPSELVYMYGLTFTIFLAILYVPVHYRLRAIAKDILETTEDKSVDKLSLMESPLKNLQPILSIFAPLLGSVFSELVKYISL